MTHTPTTGAVVRCIDFKFGDDGQVENNEVITMTADTAFNGPTPNAGIPVTFPRAATRAVKADAVREAINAFIQSNEPGIPLLSNADIQISGLPV